MELVNCPECKKEISSSAKICPHCGYKLAKNNRGCFTLFIGLIVIFLIIYIIGSIDSGNKNNKTDKGTNIINDNNTYTKSWRAPHAGSETVAIGRIMVKNNITGCDIIMSKKLRQMNT
jgi:RNA polymerase subunit RPABC4/transcription elongation factor Spt4